MIEFAHIGMLWLLTVPAGILVLFLLYLRGQRKRRARLADAELLSSLMPAASRSAVILKFILLELGLILMIIAASGPRIGSKLREVEQKGREIIIALDVSNSMLAEDIKPSRLERSKQLIYKLVDRMDHDRIGLIVFAGDAYTQIPITDDYPSVKMFLSGAGPEMVSRQGTSIGAAIALATRSFPGERSPSAEDAMNRAIIVITDGENHEDDALQQAEEAAENGIRVLTVGLGDPRGVPLPVRPGSSTMRRDRDGNMVVSKLNEALLIQVAEKGSGAYFKGDRLSSLMDELEKLEQAQMKTRIFSDYTERFQYFTGFALLLLLLEFLLRNEKSKVLQRLRLISDKSLNLKK